MKYLVLIIIALFSSCMIHKDIPYIRKDIDLSKILDSSPVYYQLINTPLYYSKVPIQNDTIPIPQK